jgi:hypothetical protein
MKPIVFACKNNCKNITRILIMCDEKMTSIEQSAEECDATGVTLRYNAGLKKIFQTLCPEH